MYTSSLLLYIHILNVSRIDSRSKCTGASKATEKMLDLQFYAVF